MLPYPPAVVGMTICRDFLRDPTSGNYTVIRSFTGHPVGEFPGAGEPFCVFSLLTDAVGETETELIVTWFGEDEIVEYARARRTVRFPDPLRLVEYVLRFDQFPLPGPGVYLFTLLADGEWLAQKAIRVYRRGESP